VALRTFFLLDNAGFEIRQNLRERMVLNFLQQLMSRNKERGLEGPDTKVKVDAFLKEWGREHEVGAQWLDINVMYFDSDDETVKQIMWLRSVKLKDTGGATLDDDRAFTTPDVIGKAVAQLRNFCSALHKRGIGIKFIQISCGLMPLADAEHDLYLDPQEMGVDIIPDTIHWRKYYTNKYPEDASNYMKPRWTRSGEERTGGPTTVYAPDMQHMMAEVPAEMANMMGGGEELMGMMRNMGAEEMIGMMENVRGVRGCAQS